MLRKSIDANRRRTHDLEKLIIDLSGLVTELKLVGVT